METHPPVPVQPPRPDPPLSVALGPRRKRMRQWRAKYLVERAIATVGLLLILPILGVLALLIKATSRGPVFYVADRLGRNGQVFRLFKLRSMHVDSPQVLAEDGKVVTLARDARLTPVGRFLRLGFDELPQLINVVRGDMCLVGPRPDLPWELERYTPRQRRRLEVLPGITGLTQVVGGRELNNAQNYEMDVRYVEGSWLGTDVMILLLTLPYSFGAKTAGRRCFRRFMAGIEGLGE